MHLASNLKCYLFSFENLRRGFSLINVKPILNLVLVIEPFVF